MFTFKDTHRQPFVACWEELVTWGRYKFSTIWLLFYIVLVIMRLEFFFSCYSLKWNFEVICYNRWFRQLSISCLKVRWGRFWASSIIYIIDTAASLTCLSSREFSTSLWIRILLKIEKQFRETYQAHWENFPLNIVFFPICKALL